MKNFNAVLFLFLIIETSFNLGEIIIILIRKNKFKINNITKIPETNIKYKYLISKRTFISILLFLLSFLIVKLYERNLIIDLLNKSITNLLVFNICFLLIRGIKFSLTKNEIILTKKVLIFPRLYYKSIKWNDILSFNKISKYKYLVKTKTENYILMTDGILNWKKKDLTEEINKYMKS